MEKIIFKRVKFKGTIKYNPSFWAKLLTSILIFQAFVVWDILGLETYSSTMSRDKSTQATSYFYPREPDNIVIVNTNRRSAEIWPPTYLSYANWFEHIADYQPKAVVFGINFEQRRNQSHKDYFIEVLSDAQKKGIKLYGIHDKSSDLEITSLLTPIGTRWDKLEDGFYPVRDSNGTMMAATKVYFDFHPKPNPTIDTDIFIKWPSRPPKASLTFGEKIQKGIVCLMSTCRNDSDDIPYLDKYLVQDVFMHSEEATQAFSERIVFFGSELPASRDFFKNPIYGQVPGVFVHAMALDNLIKYGDQYFKRDSSKSLFFGLGSGTLIEASIFLINLILFLRFESKITTQHLSDRMNLAKITGQCFLWAIFCSALIAFGMYVSHFLLRNDPGNFLGLLTTNLFFYEFFYFLIHFIVYTKTEATE